jgi:N utilization substance protein B
MTEPIDPRHQRRIEIMQQVFACTFTETNLQNCLAEQQGTVLEILKNLENLDKEISAAASERPLSEINKVDLAILRSILHEARSAKTPKKVLINEAVELAKQFGSDSSSRFVNGVLAKLLLENK